MRDCTESLNIVNDGRFVAITTVHREGRFISGKTALAFKALDQSSFFSADVRSRTSSDLHIEIKSFPANVLSEKSSFYHVLPGLIYGRNKVGVFSSEVYDPMGTADGVSADSHPLDEPFRILLQKDPVLESTRFTLISITDHVFHIGRGGTCKVPFDSGWESCPAATFYAGISHHVNNISR